jgi:hypothetical protein
LDHPKVNTIQVEKKLRVIESLYNTMFNLVTDGLLGEIGAGDTILLDQQSDTH